MTLMDPEDQQFGHKAAEDQELVDALDEKDEVPEDLPEEAPREHPRPGRTAEES